MTRTTGYEYKKKSGLESRDPGIGEKSGFQSRDSKSFGIDTTSWDILGLRAEYGFTQNEGLLQSSGLQSRQPMTVLIGY